MTSNLPISKSDTPDQGQRPEHLSTIDGLRAVAVLSVLVSHTGKYNLGEATSSLITRCSQLGTHGVELFFVISGFCLALPFLRNFRNSHSLAFDGPKFFAGRVVRILPPYYVAVGVLALLSLTAIWHATAAQGLGGMTERLTLVGLLGHTFFAAREWELLNGSFWTLRVEAIWYLLFPLLLIAFVRNRTTFLLIGVACVLAAIFQVFRAPFGTIDVMMLALPAFMLGILAADMQVRSIRPRRLLWICLIPTAVIAVAADLASLPWQKLAWDLCAFLLVALANCDPWLKKIFSIPFAVAVGVASYSIYLVHMPIVAMLEHAHLPPFLALAVGLCSGFAFWWLVERPLMSEPIRRPMVGALRRIFALCVPKRYATTANDRPIRRIPESGI